MASSTANKEEKIKIHKDKGNDLFKKNKYKEAVDEFTKCIELNENDHVIFSNRSGAYAQLQLYDESLEDAEKCIKLKPDWPKGYSRKGLALYNLGLTEESQKAYEAGLKLDPNNEALKEGLKTVKESSNGMQNMAAMSQALQAIQSNPKLRKYAEDPNYLKQLVDIIKQIKKNPSSLKMFINQPDVRLREGLLATMGINLGEEEDEEDELFGRQKSAEQKEKEKQEAEKKKKESQKPAKQIEADSWKDKGNEFYKKKDFENAIEAYQKSIELYPDDLTYSNNLAAAYLEKGDYEKCIEICEKSIERRYEVKADFPLVAKIFARMGACYMKKKDYDNAIRSYEKSLLEDNNRHVRTSLKEAERSKHKAQEEAFINPDLAEQHRLNGNEFFKKGDFPSAKKEYDIAIKRNPSDAKLYSNRAAALAKLIELPSALADTEKCIELDPTFVKAWIRKGNLHMMLKEFNKAIQAFDKGLKIQPDNAECKEGKINVMMKIHQMNQSGEVDEEQYRHAMADPEIQQILSDPQFNLILKRITEHPSSLQEYMKDPKIADGIQKLMMAGILRTA